MQSNDDLVVFLGEFGDSRHSRLPGWMVDQAAGMLEYLGRAEEAERVAKLKRRYTP